MATVDPDHPRLRPRPSPESLRPWLILQGSSLQGSQVRSEACPVMERAIQQMQSSSLLALLLQLHSHT